MQYKIPVQIENADPILLWLSLKQLWIIMIWGGLWYAYFKWMEPKVWAEMAAIPAWIIIITAIFIAVFKSYEMTFFPFMLAFLRLNINSRERHWEKWIDCFQPIEIWFITDKDVKIDEKIDFKTKMDKINELNDKLKKI